MKRHFTAILILMFLTVILSCGVEDETDSDNENGSDTDNGEKTDDPEEIVVFPDPGLEKCVRDEIHQDSGDLLYKDVSMQLFLDCVGKGVENLDGIEKMVSLKYVELGNNKIKDVTPLGKCVNLRDLELDNNEIEDASPLKDLVNLTRLNISNNSISDISY
ncbi:MAG TPA: hypothetical protein PLW78_13700, partial [bacterium]|nr:hypothetical protein [bacterium]